MSSPHVFEVTVTNFESDVIVRSQQVPVLLDFWADWCGPCKTLGPVLAKLADEYGGAFRLGTVDAEAQPELAQAFQVQSIPFCVLLVGGRPADAFQGAMPEAEVRRFLERAGIEPAADTGPAESETEDPLRDARSALQRGAIADARTALDKIADDDEQAPRAANLRAGLEIFDVDAAGDDSPAAAPAMRGRDLFLGGQTAAAVEEWIESLAADRSWRDGLARRAAVMAFDVLAVNDAGQELVRELRGRMATLLY